MEIFEYVFAVIGVGFTFYHIGRLVPQTLLNKFIGEIVWAVGKDGKKYRVLRAPTEPLHDASSRLIKKMAKAGAI